MGRSLSSVPPTESVAYHAARLLVLIDRCGKPQQSQRQLPGITGRTLLAKLDFFLRYPAYLRRAVLIASVLEGSTGRVRRMADEEAARAAEESDDEGLLPAETVEAPMVRYKYGPWDHLYYVVLAYLMGKGLIEVELAGRKEVFRLTPQGEMAAEALAERPEYADIIERAEAVHAVFGGKSGNTVKTFIYQHFPEIVAAARNERI